MHEKWETFFIAALTGASVDTTGDFTAATVVNEAADIADVAGLVWDNRRQKAEKKD